MPYERKNGPIEFSNFDHNSVRNYRHLFGRRFIRRARVTTVIINCIRRYLFPLIVA